MTFLYQLRDHFDSKSIAANLTTFSSNYNLDRPADQTVQSLDSLKSSSVKQSPSARPKLIKPTSLAASTPIKALSSQHDVSANPFEENEKETGQEVDPIPAPSKQLKVDKNNNKEQPSSGIIQILPDGQITDAMKRDTSEQVPVVNSSRKKRQLPQQPVVNEPAATVMDSEQLYEKAKQLIERNKIQQQKSISVSLFFLLIVRYSAN